jgi:hypothetical protein
MKFEELKLNIESFLSTKRLEEEDVYVENHLVNVAEKEMSGCDDILFTDDNNHTQAMRTEIIKKYRDKFVNWKHTFEGFVQRLSEVKEENSSSKTTSELNKLVRDKEETMESARTVFSRENNYKDAQTEKEGTHSRYHRMLKDNGGKPPRMTPFWVYLPGLIGVGAVEALINYSTFEEKFDAAGLAMGMTLIIAFVFAAVSHVHGGYLKQRHALIGRDVEKSKRNQTLIVQAVASLLLMVALAGLIIIRYYVIQDEINQAPMANSLPGLGLPGAETGEPSVWALLFPTILFNLAVWGLGTFISYWVHDARPDFKEAKRDYEKAAKKFRVLDNKLNEEYDQIEAKFVRETTELKSRIEIESKEALKAQQLISLLEQEYNKMVEASLLRINDGLRQYRNAFVSIAKAKGKLGLKVGAQQIDLDTYLSIDIDFNSQNLAA